MIKAARHLPRACINSLRPSHNLRNTSTVANGISLPASYVPSSAQQDDQILRQVFDSQQFWSEFSKSSRNIYTQPSVGLLRNRYLATPNGFLEYADKSMVRCSRLVDKIAAIDTVEGYRGIVRDLDRISDLLCRVIDLADFVRSNHRDRRFQLVATEAYAAMFEYMNKLNTATALSNQLEEAGSIPEVYNSWTEEERRAYQIFLQDFNRSAGLPAAAQDEFVQLTNAIAKVGSDFVDSFHPAKNTLRFPSSRLKGVNPLFIRNNSSFGVATIATTGDEAHTVMTRADDPEVRRDLFVASRTASRSSLKLLEAMLDYRTHLASLCGFDSFGQMALQDKMAKTPEAVSQFLQALRADNQPKVDAELEELLDLKRADALGASFPEHLDPWDKAFYSTRLNESIRSQFRHPIELSEYFSVGTVFQGLSRLFTRIYGVRFVPQELLPGEGWHDEVRKLHVADDSTGRVLAVVYCDLFYRDGKNPGAAHFTLRCSRTILPDEIAEYAAEDGLDNDPISAASDGLATWLDPNTNIVHQLPTIALVCDFRPPVRSSSSSSAPACLQPSEVQTLFHEMGHAVHSIFGQTSLQNVTGTRCATDLAELPSTLTERFAFSPLVLPLWARHWSTNEPLPQELVRQRLRMDARGTALETENQILMATVDQALHSKRVGSTVSAAEAFAKINASASLPDPPGTSWYGLLAHLYGYGASYYSYLFSRALAGRVWKVVFDNGAKALDRDAGERVKNELLRFGGARDPWKCVASVLRDESLKLGDEQAVKRVGEWGVSKDPGSMDRQ
jgi:mitochondrial intermediate peptidase